jgi:hypothetical protein
MPSVPPPSLPPLAADQTPALAQELLLELEGGARRRDGDRLRLSAGVIAVEHGRVMHSPLELPLSLIKVAAVDPGPAQVQGKELGRFAVLKRLGPTAVIPRTEGIEGWLWTSTGGTALTNLGGENDAPNVALLFTKPLEEAQLRAAFDPEFVTALAARSPLGSPTVLGVLFRVAESAMAENGFRRWGFQSMLTDKEVPPTLRRHLPTDRPADPVVRGRSDEARAATSVPPPGFS